jgi:hypothetical protein
MYDAITVTLIILITALLRRSLLIDLDASAGVREEEENTGFPALIPVIAKAERPHPAWQNRN